MLYERNVKRVRLGMAKLLGLGVGMSCSATEHSGSPIAPLCDRSANCTQQRRRPLNSSGVRVLGVRAPLCERTQRWSAAEWNGMEWTDRFTTARRGEARRVDARRDTVGLSVGSAGTERYSH